MEHGGEIPFEHSRGMTCEPAGGQLQIPSIERNAMGAANAVPASRLALNECGTRKIALHQVIRAICLTSQIRHRATKKTVSPHLLSPSSNVGTSAKQSLRIAVASSLRSPSIESNREKILIFTSIPIPSSSRCAIRAGNRVDLFFTLTSFFS